MHATLNCSLSCISIQLLAGHDHGLWSNGHQLGIDSAGPYPTMNYVNALPPTRYSTSTGYDDDPPHLAIVSVCLQPSCRVPFVDSGFCRRALQIYKSTEVNVNLTVTARPWSTSTRAPCSYNSCMCSPIPHSHSSRTHTAFLTASLTAGGAQRPSPESRSFSSQYSRAVSRQF